MNVKPNTLSLIAVSAALYLGMIAANAASPANAKSGDAGDAPQVFSPDGPLFVDPELARAIEPAGGDANGFGLDSATQGCDSGFVCVYPENAGWNGGRPSLRYYRYGCYNFSNQYNYHVVFNNQTNAALAQLWTGYNCTGTKAYIFLAGAYANTYLTPINSISLSP